MLFTSPTGARARSPIALLLCFALALVAPACHPQPAPDGGTVTPSGVLAVVDTVAALLDILLPAIRPLILRQVPEGPAKPAVLVSLAGFEATASAWQAGRATWDARGGDRCAAYALSGALTDATRDLVASLGRAGVGWGPDLEALLTSLGRAVDRLVGACPASDGGALATSGRTGDAIRAFLDGVDGDARARGVSLVPLSAVRR